MDERQSLQALIARHCGTLRANTDLIGQFIDAMDTADEEAALSQALDLAHQVAGAGGSIGFRSVSVAAKALELELKRPPRVRDAAGRAAIRQRFETLREIVTAISPEESTLYGMDFARSGVGRQRRS